MSHKEIVESSGLVKSRQFNDVFWTHNDSQDYARIFAITSRGELIKDVKITGAENVDWEDVAIDDAGHLFIGDTGNNDNDRRDLAVYIVQEPNPYLSDSAVVVRRIPFRYPDQEGFPNPQNRNFDCEAIFWADGKLYALTKHRSDRRTKLYRFGSLEDESEQTLTKIGEFEIDGSVTSADVSVDGSQLLVLCYQYIYLFEKPSESDNYLAGSYKRILFAGRSSEGICFAGREIFFSNEQREIYRLPESIFEQTGSFIPELPQLRIPKLANYRLDGSGHEWKGVDGGQLSLNLNKVQQMNHSRCVAPSARIGLVEDGLLLWVRNWELPKGKKKKRVDLMNVMVGSGDQKSVALGPGQFVWKLSRKHKKYSVSQEFPRDPGTSADLRIATVEAKSHIAMELYIPLRAVTNGRAKLATPIRFNLILNPSSQCEWYWSADAATFSEKHPYLWGDLIPTN
ncbi:hypothetical protein MJD09_06815 [bacterium]|nr:hypothetical protein [bacterium]